MISEERIKDIRDNHTCYKRAGDCDQCDLLADRDQLIERIEQLRAALQHIGKGEQNVVGPALAALSLDDEAARATANTGRK